MKRINPNTLLDGHRLRDALESLYCTFSSVLLGSGATDEPKLYEETIPGMVFDAAVGAGWLDFRDDDNSPIKQADWHPSSKTVSAKWVLEHIETLASKGKRIAVPSAPRDRNHVLLGDFIVDRSYADSFYVLLRDWISFHLATGTELEELRKRLPAKTSKDERKALLKQYIDEQHRKGYKISMLHVTQRADVDYSVFTKWKNGKLLDSKPASQRIALLLRFGKRTTKRRYYKSTKVGR